MKKILILFAVVLSGLMAANVPGVVHLVYENGEVTTSGDDVFYEFDINVYITDTENTEDLLFGNANIYVEYDPEIFGSQIAGSANLSYEKIGILTSEFSGIPLYEVYNSQNTFSDVFALTVDASLTLPSIYPSISSDPENPSGLFHITMKANNSGTGDVKYPYTRIVDPDSTIYTLANTNYAGPHDFSQAQETVNIEGPISGEPYTSIELDYFKVADKGGKVRLKWRTQSESENLGFIIKRARVFGDVYGAFEEIDSYMTNDDLVGAGSTSKKSDYLYWDKEVVPGGSYAYVLQDVDLSGDIRESDPVIVQIKESKLISADEYEFSASYPNPFNPAFVIPFEIYKSTHVDIKLYDVSGRLVRTVANKEFSTGTYNLLVQGNGLSSGVYLLKIQVDNVMNTQKMLLVK